MISLNLELPSLQSFYFRASHDVSITLSQYPKLEAVEVNGGRSLVISDCPCLRRIVSFGSSKVTLSSLPSLSYLELHSVSYEDSADFSGVRMIIALVVGFPNLQEVRLHMCTFKSYDSLIFKGCDYCE